MKVTLEIPDSDPHLIDDLFSDAMIWVIQKRLKSVADADSNKEYKQIVKYYDRKITAYEQIQQSAVFEK